MNRIPENERKDVAMALLFQSAERAAMQLFVTQQQIAEVRTKLRDALTRFHEQFPQESKFIQQNCVTLLDQLKAQEEAIALDKTIPERTTAESRTQWGR